MSEDVEDVMRVTKTVISARGQAVNAVKSNKRRQSRDFRCQPFEKHMAVLALEKGRVYRLAFAPTIKKGGWYIGVKCKKCGNATLVLDDPQKGKIVNLFVGEGKVSIACHHCDSDETYAASDLKPFEALYNRRSFRERRITPSG